MKRIACYFLKASEFEKQLKDMLNSHDFTFPSSRINELKGFISNGLKDICISRLNGTWGIDVPTEKNQKIYVWIDALLNYLSVIDYKKDNEEIKEFYLKGLTFHYFVNVDEVFEVELLKEQIRNPLTIS